MGVVDEVHYAPRTDVPRKHRACRNVTLAAFGLTFLGGAVLLFVLGDHDDTVALGFVLIAMGIATLALGAVYIIRDCCFGQKSYATGLNTQQCTGDGDHLLLEQVPSTSASENIFPADASGPHRFDGAEEKV